MHYFEGGGCIGRFPLATNETYTNKQTNERVTNTEWHNVVLWTPLAEIAERFLHKGSQVYIERLSVPSEELRQERQIVPAG